MVTKLRAHLDGANPAATPIDPSVTYLAQCQEQIGWDQLLKGRFSKQWACESLLPTTQQRAKVNWTVSVIEFIFVQWWQLWESRNQDRHGRDLATKLQAAHLQAHRELRLLYDEYQPRTPQTFQWLFDIDISTRKQWTTPAIWQWIHTWKPVLDEVTNPQWAPTNEENFPHTTALETG